MIRRFGRPGLLGAIARTAVVAGTATAVVGGIQRHQQNTLNQQQAEDDAQSELSSVEAQVNSLQAQQAAPAAPGGGSDVMAQLTQLGSMHSSGVLTDAEFAAAKAKLLGL